MPRIKASFENQQGETLAGLLEAPETPPLAYALFAHCFTCSKDIAAASRISRALAGLGIAVLRFDFTGLGNSDGDFANTNFSSNVQDLVAAAHYLETKYQAPAMLIGHSLGGAAVLAAAQVIPSSKAIVTIGAPASAAHVEHLFTHKRSEILEDNEANVSLGGREFRIKRQFLDDIAAHNDQSHIRALKQALLVFHSPIDEIVSIDEAGKIYQAAKHPKSFVSLDKADHLLSKREDSQYVAAVIAAWAGRYLSLHEIKAERSSGTAPAVTDGQVRVMAGASGLTQQISTHHHQITADEPAALGGLDLGPNPYELLLASLGACTSMTLRMYAKRKNIALDNIDIELSHNRIHAKDCEACESSDGLVAHIARTIELQGDLSEEQRQRLLAIADKCPVHKTLSGEIVITSELIDSVQ